MLLIVASNPAIDRTLHVPCLEPGRVHRTGRVHLGAGGKGLNVARAARILGFPARVTGCLAGHTGDLVADLAHQEGLEACWHRLPRGETRNCLLLNHDQGDATVINEAGPTLEPEDWEHFAGHIQHLAEEAEAVVLAGSVPPSVDPERYAGLCRRLARRVGRVWVDSPGPPLAALLRDPAGLSLKVNRTELAEALGQDLEAPGRMGAALRALIGAGACLAGITLGPHGALVATPEGAWRVTTPEVDLVSSVGSGDAFLAGLAVGTLQHEGFSEALGLAAACGAANAETPYPARFQPDRVAELRARCQVEPAG